MRARASAFAPLAIAAACLSGCALDEPILPAPLDAGRLGSSIAILPDGALAVVNPDQGSVSLVDPDTLEQLATIDVGGEPHALLPLRSGAILVATYRGGEAVLVDPTARAVTARRSICAGPYGLAESPDGAFAAVSCEWEGAVMRLDPATLDATPIASSLSRPRGLAVIGSDVYVAELTGGHVARVEPDGAVTRTSLVPASAPYRPALTSMTANLATGVLPAFGALHVPHELVNHTGNTTVEHVADDYGSVLDDNPKINPAVTSLAPGADHPAGAASPPVLYARFDGGPRVFNGPSAIAAFDPHYLVVTHLSTADVAILDATATDRSLRVVASYRVGSGPSGVAIDQDHRLAFVDNALDGSISRLDLSLPSGPWAPRHEASLTRVRDLPARYSPAAIEGRRIFHDATNQHLTPSGVVACSTCHPGGGDDGLVWFIHTSGIPLKRRRTPHLADAHTGTAPFHWNGEFATIADLVSATLTDLMAGDALLIDRDAVRSYVDEIVAPPLPPAGDPVKVDHGRSIFESAEAGCATCHFGPDLTDGQKHAVLQPMSLSADDEITAADTPALHALFLRAPYFHDGRAKDLRDLLTRKDAAGHGSTAGLSPADVDDLIAYLKSL